MFKKLFSLFAALTLSVGLWAEAPANAESVDLGLPSGLKWATFNVGATAPEGYGDYFAWGETEPKEVYNWSTYKYCSNGQWSGITKYTYPDNQKDGIWYDGDTFIGDNKTTLDQEDDAAHVNWGSDWRMPTLAELDELRVNCTWTWTADYNGTGVKGYIVTSKAEGNTNSIFLPAAGYRDGSSLYSVGSNGYCWSSSLYEEYSDNAYYLDFFSEDEDDGVDCSYFNRIYGQSVRPVTTKLIVPEPKVGDQFVDATSGLKFEVTAVGDTNTVKVISNSYSGTSYTVPDTVKYLDVDFAVTEIGSVAFAGCFALQSITIPTSVTTIGAGAFNGCLALQSVTLSVSVTTIAKNAFVKCSSLQSITLPEGLLTIGEQAFAASGLTSVTIPASVTTIGAVAFGLCSGLTSVTFEGNACQNAIGEMAFDEVGRDAPALLTLPNSWTGTKPDEDGNWYGGKFTLAAPAKTSVITYTAEEKLQETTDAKTVGLHLNAFYAADSTQLTVTHTFDEAESVGTITLDGEVAIIGEEAFYKCSSLQSITIPDGVTTIGEYALYKCYSLQSITIPDGVTTIGEYAFAESGFTSITIPGGVTTIENYVFCECTSLTSITIPAKVTKIGEAAFANTGLTSITIPAGVTEIGMGAFYECVALQSVTFLGNACQNAIGEDAFGLVGDPDPALLTLPNSWTGTKPDEDGNWYGGKFEMSSTPTALPTVKNAVKATKVMTNGQVIFRAENKNYNALGQEVR